ncbi:MAG: hypothetical protein EOT05_03635 [Candidatus Microsaccharimonas sossegonensis]|uniref:Uncharacterized protein n=1 Tax=Candidatus Microsaccharimonas sossegonensis TaxID=2506948 RepID=A0A4Q0AHZ9_9BACT|nr:MAG: hypothetical protein EOT05_03635 [Candidatus Microsaccharimonas sossegonensis]
MPRIAHNWTHDVTYPAVPPTREVAIEYMKARTLADSMQTVARHPAFLAKETLRIYQEVYPHINEEQLHFFKLEIEEDKQLDLEHQLGIFSKLFEAAKAGPKEFQVIEYDSLALHNTADMLRISQKIARHVMNEASVDKRLLTQENDKIAA